MRVKDFYMQRRRGWVRLHEKGGNEHAMPTHHNLDRYLEQYIAGPASPKTGKGRCFVPRTDAPAS